MAINLLIVDDSLLTRKAIRRIIDMIGLDIGEVLEAENGAEALEVLDGAKVDLVLADLNMPVMCGMEMIYNMRGSEATKSIPVVIVSAESSRARIEGLLADGAGDYLHKPFRPEEFKEVIERIMGVQSYD